MIFDDQGWIDYWFVGHHLFHHAALEIWVEFEYYKSTGCLDSGLL